MKIESNQTLFGAIESLSQIVSSDPSPERIRERALAEGLDPEFVDEAIRRITTQETKGFLAQQQTASELSREILGLFPELNRSSGLGEPDNRFKLRDLMRKTTEKHGLPLQDALDGLCEAVFDDLQGLEPFPLSKFGEALLQLADAEEERRVAAGLSV